MSTVYNVGEYEKSAENTRSLAQTLREQVRPDGRAVYTPLLAITLMVFYVFALQCVSTVAIVRRETNSWKWPLVSMDLHGGAGLGVRVCDLPGRALARVSVDFNKNSRPALLLYKLTSPRCLKNRTVSDQPSLNQPWCERLYDACARQLILYGRALGLSHGEAEDVLQDTFVALLQRESPPGRSRALLRAGVPQSRIQLPAEPVAAGAARI